MCPGGAWPRSHTCDHRALAPHRPTRPGHAHGTHTHTLQSSMRCAVLRAELCQTAAHHLTSRHACTWMRHRVGAITSASERGITNDRPAPLRKHSTGLHSEVATKRAQQQRRLSVACPTIAQRSPCPDCRNTGRSHVFLRQCTACLNTGRTYKRQAAPTSLPLGPRAAWC